MLSNGIRPLLLSEDTRLGPILGLGFHDRNTARRENNTLNLVLSAGAQDSKSAFDGWADDFLFVFGLHERER